AAARRPGACGVAAGAGARNLGVAVDVDRVGVLPALQPVRLVGRAGHHRSIAAGIRIAPGDRGAGSSAFERLHLRRIRALLVLVVHAGADAIADEPADRGAGQPGGDALAGPAAELRANQTAG